MHLSLLLKKEIEMTDKKTIAKKIIIVYVLNILKLYSSELTPITQTTICNYLNDIGIPCDRKTIGRNIEYLMDFGYPIRRVGAGYYIDSTEMKKRQTENKFIM